MTGLTARAANICRVAGDATEKLADPSSLLPRFSRQTAPVLGSSVFPADEEQLAEELCSTLSLGPVPEPGNGRDSTFCSHGKHLFSHPKPPPQTRAWRHHFLSGALQTQEVEVSPGANSPLQTDTQC